MSSAAEEYFISEASCKTFQPNAQAPQVQCMCVYHVITVKPSIH